MFVTGSTNIIDEDELITTEDINKVIKESVYSKIAQDYELITVIPLVFLIDGKPETKPCGKTGKVLEVKGIMITAPKKEYLLSTIYYGRCWARSRRYYNIRRWRLL